MRGEDVNASGVEHSQVLNACANAWAAPGRAGLGITAVNVNLFHEASGEHLTNTTPGMLAGAPIGSGGGG